MATAMVIGAQWGDEGKGKIVDYLAAKADVVVRSQGGNNAGHTVVTGGKAYPLRLMPSGIMYPGTICIVGTGVVVDPKSLLEEMENLEKQGIDAKHLQISTRAQVVFPYHIRLDEAEESRKGQPQDRHNKERHRTVLRRQDQPYRHPHLRPHGQGNFC